MQERTRGVGMTFLNNFAAGLGYWVMLMFTLGAITPLKFTMLLTGPDVHNVTLYTCESGDSFATRKKHLCSREEWEAKKNISAARGQGENHGR